MNSINATTPLLPCPCCGHRGLLEAGGYEICSRCGWEDDPSQAARPDMAGGANRMSLHAARQAWARGEPVA
ncbi:CPCC family cysteine-rich protein [Stenotrophomonas sp. BIGb0135]|jgi:DNA-directed RNA polymerase subunit RPC12/RpoP|uniref:CPCC family cysteine-rich protein n=1 Tax=Stenotrophomonas sp. BIGb0135 TaxID=2940620 RepID=UPI002168873E|nr:CPCC family cysteine-rich protein [Stenotrophomonas sp. BIGb0135]MCS4233194.1 DNA-directed RNA polymerase subunit RPC12/RpoP [Stenotrophomonas sp. BIGb0135]